MKIVHVTDYFHPMLGYQDTFLALAELRQGHDVSVVTSDRYRPFESYDETVGPLLGPRRVGAGRRTEQGIDVLRLPVLLEVHFRCWLDGLEKAVLSLRPDLVIVHGVTTGHASRLARMKRRAGVRRCAPFSLIVDDHMVPGPERSLSARVTYGVFRRLGAQSILREADAIVAVTSATKRFMMNNYGFADTDISVIPLGADTVLFRRRPERRAELRRKYGYVASDVVFIYAGKITKSKGTDILVSAALAAMESRLPVKVMIVGDGPEAFTGELRRRIDAAGRTADFHWHPPVLNRDLPDLFSVADVGVWAARSSLAMIEAQSCELPIIVSSFPAAAERVRDRNGLIFAEGEADDLAAAMLSLMDESTRREMGRRGREIVRRDRDYRVLSDRFLALMSRNSTAIRS
jgi:glycosyltransferase involved in cell wall biosynthesis